MTLNDFQDCGKFEFCAYCNLCPGNNYTENGDARIAGENNCYIAIIRFGLAEKLRRGEDILEGQSVADRLAGFSVVENKLKRIFKF